MAQGHAETRKKPDLPREAVRCTRNSEPPSGAGFVPALPGPFHPWPQPPSPGLGSLLCQQWSLAEPCLSAFSHTPRDFFSFTPSWPTRLCCTWVWAGRAPGYGDWKVILTGPPRESPCCMAPQRLSRLLGQPVSSVLFPHRGPGSQREEATMRHSGPQAQKGFTGTCRKTFLPPEALEYFIHEGHKI